MVSYVLGRNLPPEGVVGTLGERFLLEPRGRSYEILTYLDTFDWRLFRKGLTLTSRARSRKAALLLSGALPGPLSALSPRIPAFPQELPEGALKESLTRVMGPRCLLPQVRVRARSQGWSVLNGDGKTVVRVALREGTALATGVPALRGEGPDAVDREGARLPPFLHLLPLKGYDEELAEVVRFLHRALGLSPTTLVELTQALEAVGRTPGDYTSSLSLSLDPGARAEEAARKILSELFGVLQANEEGLILDLDSEFLHDFRVAVRRTRSALGQLKSVLPRKTGDHFREEFRWLGERTGPTRDMDVYLLKIPSYRAALPGAESRALEPLVRFLKARKGREHRALVRTLESRRWNRLQEDWSRFLEGGEGSATWGPKAAHPIQRVASNRIWRAFRRVLEMGRAITATSPGEELHRLRIEAKKLRYLLTFFQSLYPPEALAPPVEELRRLQDNLGDFNDIQVQVRALRGFAEEMMTRKLAGPETFLAMGRLVGQLETRQLLERRAFNLRFRSFARPKNRRHFKALFGSDEGTPQGPKEGNESS